LSYQFNFQHGLRKKINTIDEGAAMELGYAYSKGKHCVGYSTDPRSLLPNGQNPMIDGCLDAIAHSHAELFSILNVITEVKLCSSY